MFEQINFPVWLQVVFFIVSLWEIAWKGFGLWRAGKNNEPIWFIFMLIVNTAGILPIVYLAWFDKKKTNKK